MKKSFVNSFAVLAIVAAATLPAIAAPHMGDVAPAISIPSDKAGKTIDTTKLVGKAVYVNFFASWCPPCNAEAPSVKKLFAKYQKRGFITVGVDELEDASKATAFAKNYGWTFPVGVDTDGKALESYRAVGLPVHIFIDRKGKIDLVRMGEMGPDEIEAEIKKIV